MSAFPLHSAGFAVSGRVCKAEPVRDSDEIIFFILKKKKRRKSEGGRVSLL